MGEGLLPNLRTAYDRAVAERDGNPKAPWKVEERAQFLALQRAEGKRTLLEIGAGTGQDGLFFQENYRPCLLSDVLHTLLYTVICSLQ